MIKICLYILAILSTTYTFYTCDNSINLGLGHISIKRHLFNFCYYMSTIIFYLLALAGFVFKWWVPFLSFLLPYVVIYIFLGSEEIAWPLRVWGAHTIISFALSIIFTLSFVCAVFF
jgi:hypothetical protein